MAFVSGVSGSVLVGTVSYSFKTWELVIEQDMPQVNNFNGGGFQQVVRGLNHGQINLAGPWDVGNMPLVCGTSYSFTLSPAGGTTIIVTALVNNITINDDVEDAARVKVNARTNGSFAALLT